MRNKITILTVVVLLSMASTAAANTVASSTMYFQGSLTDNGDGTYSGVVAMIDEGGSDSGYDIFGKEGDTAWFGNDPGGGPVWTSQAIGAAHDAWPTWTPDTPDWYQYSLNLYVDGVVQKWAVRNHAGATAANPWYDTIPGWPKVARGVPMSGLMDWTGMYAAETDVGAYLLGTGVAEIPGGAAGYGGGPGAWDMDWSWGSEVVPLEFPGFDVEITDLGAGQYSVTMTPAAVSTVYVDDDFTSSTPGWGITHFDNIQDGIDAVDGSTVNVAGGTYDEGLIVIDKELTIVGDPLDKPVIKPTEDTGSGTWDIGPTGRGWYQITGGPVEFENLVFDGDGQAIYMAIQYHVGSLGGAVKNCDISNIQYVQYKGRGIANYGGYVEVLDSTFANIERIGVFTGEIGAESLIKGCTYTGKGAGDWLDYAFEVGAGATATIEDNTITDCYGEDSGWDSAGIYVHEAFGPGTSATIMGNTISGCNNGIVVGYGTHTTSEVVAHYNNIAGNDCGVKSIGLQVPQVDATYNWWGAADGPNTVGPGSGDNISTNVDYDPWMPVLPDLVVDPCGYGDYTTIQDAVDNANPGDIIFVVSGLYAGAIVDEDVTIIGSSNPAVIVDGPHYGGGHPTAKTAFRLEDTADGAEIKNFIIECNEPDDFYFAVFARSADDVTIDSLTVNGAVQGITNYGGSGWDITNNILNSTLPSGGGGIGIMLGTYPPTYTTCSNNVVQGNRIITNIPGAPDFTCPAVLMSLDCRYSRYDILTFSEEMTGNQILNNIMKDEDHSNQVGVEVGVIGLGGDPVKIAAVIGMIHDNTIKDNTIQDTDAGVYFYNISTLTIEDNTIRNCADNGVSIEGDQNDCSINNNSIYGNANYGVDNNTPSMVDAEYNWWGAASGPDDDDNVINGSGDKISTNVDADPWLGADPWVNILKLDAHSDPVYLNPDGAVGPNQLTIDMDALDLAQHVFGCQAILNFSSAYFLAGPTDVTVVPGGGVWDELIYSIWDAGGDLDVAVGVDLQCVVGTKADGTVAKFTLTVDPGAPDGTTNMVFRTDVDEDESTYFADFLSQRVDPGSKLNSQDIIIDGTDPSVTVTYPNGAENIKGGSTCTITWNTTETNKDYVDLEYTDDDGTSWNSIATGENDDGSYDWTPVPLVDTSLAKVRVTATDLAGNSGSDDSDSTFIIDSTVPSVDITSASQNPELLISLGSTTNAVQGQVDIDVAASDSLSGLDGHPIVTVDDSGANPMAVTYDGESPAGTFNYHVTVASSTANGIATINASVSDNSGNTNSDSDTFNINKNEITGTVEFDTLSSAAYGFNRDVVFKATDGGDNLLKTWTETVSFTNNTGTKIASGPYTLTDVPAGTVNLSAKTAWNLRRRITGLDMSLDDGQETADFTGANDLLGGDLNNSNGINILDYSVLKVNWGTTNAVADINGDGMVQLLDYSILKSNFFKKGDAE